MARIMTPDAILSYPNLFTPRAATEGGDPKYSCTLVFTAEQDLRPLKAAALAVAKETFGAQAEALIKQKKIKWPFRDDEGDVEGKGYPEGSTFLNVRSNKKPGVVSIYPGPDGKPLPIEDPDKVYPGVIVRATIEPFTYNRPDSKGVTFGLGNVQVLREGERLDGRAKAEDEFDADMNATVALEVEAEDDLSDLM
jgi:hypothetical protein